MRTFNFVDRNDVRLVLEDYYAQAKKAETANSYLGSVVGCGAVAEGLLTWALKKRDVAARVAVESIFARQSWRAGKPRPNKPIESWSLEILIDVAKELGLLDHDAEQACETIRNYRNLVHPYKRVNGSPRFDASLEKSAFRAVERIVQVLGGTASPAKFSDEEMNFGWIIEDRLAGCRRPNTREDLRYLWDKGIRALVRLDNQTQVTVEQVREIGIADYLDPVTDFGTPTKQQLDNILNFIDQKYKRKIPVAVSCGAGYGRTGTILACFHLWQDRSAQDPLTWLDEVRPESAREIREHTNQHKFISAFHRRASAK